MRVKRTENPAETTNASKLQRIGLYGGSFDPVHIGHLILAQDALEKLVLARLHLMPARVNPFKQNATMTDAKHRLAMLRIAAAGLPGVVVDDREIQRGGVSYAIDTVHELRKEYPNAEIFLIIGEDNLPMLNKWHRFEELRMLVTFAVFPRPDAAAGKLASGAVPFVRIGRRIDISSTEIRTRIAARRSVAYLLPEPVLAYVKNNRLYSGKK